MLRHVTNSLVLAGLVGLASGCGGNVPTSNTAATTATTDPTAAKAHENYETAINSNNLDQLVGMLTDDIVYLTAHEPVVVGKKDVRAWLDGYLKQYKIHWDKPVKEFVQLGPEWAMERYAYTSTETPTAGGAPVKDTGWGFAVYHKDADGKWRVARDAWASDKPAQPAAAAPAPPAADPKKK